MTKIEKRAALIKELEEMNAKADSEKRAFTDEEKKLFDEKSAEVRKLTEEIKFEEQRASTMKEFSEISKPAEGKEDRSADASFFKVEKRAGGVELRTADMTMADGGAAIAPEQFVNDISKAVEKEALVYPRVRKIPVSGAGSLGLPYEAADASDAKWTAEVPPSEISADNTWKFGKRSLSPADLTKLIKVSKKLLATSAVSIDALAKEKISQKLIAAFENAIINGAGAASGSDNVTQPLGLFTASADGVSKARDVETKTALTISADDIINMYMKLRPAYRRKAVWIMNSDILKQVMLLKDKNDQYLWHESLRVGEPSTLMGRPVLESEYAPGGSGVGGALAAGDYVMVFGDLDHYQFAYWKGMDITVANEVFAGKNQVGFYGHTLADGMPTLAEAFTRLKIKTGS